MGGKNHRMLSLLPSYSVQTSILKMEWDTTSETLVKLYWTEQRHNSEDSVQDTSGFRWWPCGTYEINLFYCTGPKNRNGTQA